MREVSVGSKSQHSSTPRRATPRHATRRTAIEHQGVLVVRPEPWWRRVTDEELLALGDDALLVDARCTIGQAYELAAVALRIAASGTAPQVGRSAHHSGVAHTHMGIPR